MKRKEFERADRGPTFVGLYPRRTKTKKEKLESSQKKHKNRSWEGEM